MSKINYYSNEEQFANNFDYTHAERPSIHYVEGPKRAYFHKSTKKADFLDVVLVNGSQTVLVPGSEFSGTSSTWVSQNPGFTPIGLVVVPSGVLPDGRARMMSLTEMCKYNAAAGVTGTTRQGLYWGVHVNLTMKNYNQIPQLDETGREITGIDSWAFLPSDKRDSENGNILDMLNGECVSFYDSASNHAPSPFALIDSTNAAVVLNRLYSAKSYKKANGDIELIANPLSDFDGFENSQIVLNTCPIDPDYVEGDPTTYQDEWEDEQENTHYNPIAFLMTKQFHTPGTSAGDWYVPAMGELGFIMPRFTEINKVLGTDANSGLRKHYSGVNVLPLDEDDRYWSSSEIDDNDAYGLDTNAGGVGNYDKDNDLYVRAFAFLPNA